MTIKSLFAVAFPIHHVLVSSFLESGGYNTTILAPVLAGVLVIRKSPMHVVVVFVDEQLYLLIPSLAIPGKNTNLFSVNNNIPPRGRTKDVVGRYLFEIAIFTNWRIAKRLF